MRGEVCMRLFINHDILGVCTLSVLNHMQEVGVESMHSFINEAPGREKKQTALFLNFIFWLFLTH